VPSSYVPKGDRAGLKRRAEIDVSPHPEPFLVFPGGGDLQPDEVELLCAATTIADVMAPGQASMVQGELGYGPLEIASVHGVCSSVMMAE